MCGRYASSRRPEDLVEEFEVDQPMLETALEPDYNVAPTKDVYAVLERPPKGEERPTAEADKPVREAGDGGDAHVEADQHVAREEPRVDEGLRERPRRLPHRH